MVVKNKLVVIPVEIVQVLDILVSQPFEDEIGVSAHNMNYLDAQKNYSIEEENEVDAVNLDVDDENIGETPEIENANIRSESINLPPRPPWRAPARSRRRTNIAWNFFFWNRRRK